MHADHSHQGLKKYREVRHKGKIKAILRAEIVKNNPDLANKPKQLEAVVEGVQAAQKRNTVTAKGHGRKGKRKDHKVVVQKI